MGAELARDFIQAQWLRIHIGINPKISGTEIEDWCPLNRIRFRLPPWWEAHDLVIQDDETLFAIYRSFAAELHEIARSSDDPNLNKTIAGALDHIANALANGTDQNTPIAQFDRPTKHHFKA